MDLWVTKTPATAAVWRQARVAAHRQTKGCGSRLATLTMVFKLALEAERHWRKLNGSELLAKVITGVRFIDGVMGKAA